MLELVPTADGSLTLRDTALGVTYHSTDGAWGETQHVFVQGSELAGRLVRGPVHILEVGFGTGLNFVAAALTALVVGQTLTYTSYEPHPLPSALLRQFYAPLAQIPGALVDLVAAGQAGTWATVTLDLRLRPWPEAPAPAADVVFFDAFDPQTVPELWREGLLAACACLNPNGVLVTYSVTGATKQLLTAAGFAYERLPGWGRKKHMLRAWKVG